MKDRPFPPPAPSLSFPKGKKKINNTMMGGDGEGSGLTVLSKNYGIQILID